MERDILKQYQQQELAPGLGSIRRMLREAQAGRYGSASARREGLRGAFRGAGEALAPLQVASSRAALNRYLPEYQQRVRAEEQRVSGEEKRAMLEYLQGLEEDQARQDIALDPGVYSEGMGRAALNRFISLGGQIPQDTEYSTVRGLTDASRRPITDTQISPLETTAASLGYPTDWMG
jgi:hypothetical protein